jgi:hypothetical protein
MMAAGRGKSGGRFSEGGYARLIDGGRLQIIYNFTALQIGFRCGSLQLYFVGAELLHKEPSFPFDLEA